ncbi:hypothetical protein DL240_18080 [Lujinxingia litoralis]|uniref:Protein kinase domain-containing protein n=1 Tax=Lujinxingia litoralis TaxID=2211119 RepID=A0A328C120_9DELT|nr:protein kinase [Lujinxingia litoralis]RAL20288.1 hypothetical protein DL240_18080 [Lujinxingia litoralis]
MAILTEGTEVAGRFVVAERIGEGGMGAVYRALQTSLDREVALKVLHSDAAFTPRARRRFGREARAVARLNHPHIASVFDFGTDNDDQTLWLAMELVDGQGMSPLKRESIDILRIVSLSDQILSALSAAHARGIIHRDLKPSNILITRDDAGREIIKLVDFGLAATRSGDESGLGLAGAPGGLDEDDSEAGASGKRVILGTPRYMAPELFRRQPVEPRVDLYALGVLLFEIFAGVPPYPGDDPREVMRGHLRAPIPRLRSRDGDLPAELERTIYKLLAKNPAERFQNAAEVREALQGVINEFSYVPWMVTGPRLGDPGLGAHPGNLSHTGFLSGYGGQTIPPSHLFAGDTSRHGPGGVPQAPLVGRERERRLIERQVRQTVSVGQGGVLFLEGEAGIGKSRLLDWARVRIEEAGVMRVAGGSHARGNASFCGMRQVLQTLLQTTDVASESLPEHLAARLGPWGFSAEEADLCLQLMSPGGDRAIFEEPDSGERRLSVQERVFAMIERVLREAGKEKPWLIVLEDLHFSGDETFAFLQHLAVGMHLDPMPVLIVATLRTEEVDQAPEMRSALERLERLGPENVLRIPLKHLEGADASSLVLKIAPVDDRLAHQIAARASGNPLHITQILGYLQESSKLQWESGEWKLAPGVDIASELPEELAELMRYRLNRLAARSEDAEATRAILDRAAILGAGFDYQLLRAFLGAEDNAPWLSQLDEVLEALVQQGFLRETGKGGRDVLEFAHVVMRDVLLQEMEGRRSLRHLHRLAAAAKKTYYGKRARERAMELVDHYRHAREPSGVYAFTVKAARAAAEGADLKRAMALYRDAKLLADSDQVSIESPLIQDVSGVLSSEEVALEVAHLERRVGEYDSAREHYRRLLGNRSPAVALWARWGLGELARLQGDLEEARSWFDAARREVKEIWQTLRTRDIRQTLQLVDTYALFGQGRLAYAQGLLTDARKLLEDGLERAQKIQHRVLEAAILRLLTDVFWRQGEARRAEVFFRRASILEESLADTEALAFGQRLSADFLREVGQPKKALDQATRALEHAESLGQRHDMAHCQLTLGRLAFSRGDFKAAAKYLRQAHHTFESLRDRHGIAHCNRALAMLAFAVDRHRETHTLISEAMEGYRALGDRHGLTCARQLLGRLELAIDKPQRALKTLADSVQHFDRIGERRLVNCARAFYALALLQTGAAGEAMLVIDQLLSDVPELALAEESLSDAFDKLASLLEDERPELATRLRELATESTQRLGRAVATPV